jgi:hypothetical protein
VLRPTADRAHWAQTQNRRAMSTARPTAALNGANHHQSPTGTGAYNPEDQFVGSLMWLSAQQARPLLQRVPATALWHPRSRWAYELIRALVDAGTDPTPVSVLQAGRHHPACNALDADTPPSPNQHKQLALYLFDAYAQAVAPTTAITNYAQDILGDAYRRAFDTYGLRMQQLAACTGATPDELAEQFAAIRDELTTLWLRAHATR